MQPNSEDLELPLRSPTLYLFKAMKEQNDHSDEKLQSSASSLSPNYIVQGGLTDADLAATKYLRATGHSYSSPAIQNIPVKRTLEGDRIRERFKKI